MSYRAAEIKTLADMLNELERRIRRLEQGGAATAPDPGWALREVNDGLFYIYVPTGAAGPQIGTK
jgi:hypothetical protein